MNFYFLFFLISLIGVELSRMSLRFIRYDSSFMDAGFYLGDIQSHLMDFGFVAFIVAVFYLNKGKISNDMRNRIPRVFNAVSVFYFFSVFLILIYAYVSSEAVKRLSLSGLIIGGALLSLLIISFNLVFLFKNREKKR